jgi:hypothetical protein
MPSCSAADAEGEMVVARSATDVAADTVLHATPLFSDHQHHIESKDSTDRVRSCKPSCRSCSVLTIERTRGMDRSFLLRSSRSDPIDSLSVWSLSVRPSTKQTRNLVHYRIRTWCTTGSVPKAMHLRLLTGRTAELVGFGVLIP